MRRKTTLLFLAVFFSAVLSGFASASPYYVYEQWGGTWHDANKSLTWSGDDNLCWAAGASNILDWAGWGTTALNNQTSIFNYFTAHWTNLGSLPEYGWHWWVDGTLPPQEPGWSQVSQSGGNFWPGVNFGSAYHEAWGGPWGTNNNLLAAVDSFFDSGYGVTLAIYKPKSGGGYYGHALTCWGYDYANGIYNGVYFTDSDDYVTELKYYAVSRNNDLYYLTGYYGGGWFIGGVEAMGQNPVPLPPTLLLFGSGLLGLVCWRRYRKE
jgi:hypothetical protein